MRHLFIVATLLLLIAPAFAFPPGTVRIYVHENADMVHDSRGSGALISSTQVLTNWHVVADRRTDSRDKNMSVQVRLKDGSRSYAAVVAQNELWDLALLQIHPTKHTPFQIGPVPKHGDIVSAQGFGGDYEYKVGSGPIDPSQQYPSGATSSDKGIIQINGYAVRQGDSGGPMTDTEGRLVGILNCHNPDLKITLGITLERAAIVFGNKMKPSMINKDVPKYIFR